jgi:arylsulfatase A-like enzyme
MGRLLPAWLAVVAALQQAAPFGSFPGAVVKTPPNVLLIVADDLGAEHLVWHPVGAEAGNPAPTPFLSSLAQSGVVFVRAYAQPACGPSRAAVLTGRHGFRHGLGANPKAGEPQLGLAEVTLAELLGRAGYATGIFGKWHVSLKPGDPYKQGFQHFDGYIGGQQGNSYYAWQRWVNGVAVSEKEYTTSAITTSAVQWIQSRAPGTPWFAMVCHRAPHAPYEPPPPELNPITNAQPTDDDITIHHGMIEALDAEVQRLVESVDLKRTLVLFVSDNGSPNAVAQSPVVPGKAKFSAYEGGVVVPVLAIGATVTRQGPEYGLVHLVDLFQTVLDVAHASASPAVTDSVTLYPRGLPAALRWLPRRDEAYAERFEPNGTPPSATPTLVRRMLTDGRYKLLRTDSGDEFYDLARDPWEANDLIQLGLTAKEQLVYDALSARITAILGS